MHYTILATPSLLEVKLAAALTHSDLAALCVSIDKLRVDQAAATPALVTFAEAWWEISGADLVSLADRMNGLNVAHWALVAPDEPFLAPLEQLKAATNAPERFVIFSDEAAARQWLQEQSMAAF